LLLVAKFWQVKRERYKWFYDHIHSRYYNLLMQWCSLPAGGERRWRNSLLEPVEFSPHERILDLGCGTGGSTFAIAAKAKPASEILGVDQSSGQLAVANHSNRYRNVRFVLGDATEVDLGSGYFDTVFICHVLHEMPRDLRLRTLRNAQRLLKPQGRLIILELDHPKSWLIRLLTALWLFYWLPFNFETRTRKDMLACGLINEVEEAGFADIRKISLHHGVFQVLIAQRPR
jgi:ubiquinone/menaquinone biosynthesis C-methylase UbiE